jgi:hypothetical protein
VSEYDKGDLVRIFTSFAQDNAGILTAVDPGTVRLRVIDPFGTETAYDYTEGQVARTGVGAYRVDLTPNQPGEWRYRWESTGVGQGAEEGRFYVRRSPFQ